MCVCVCVSVHFAPDLVVSPAGLPHAQGLSVGKLAFEAQQDPAVAEEQLQAVLPQPGQVLVEPGQHETQQFPQIHLESEGAGRAGGRGHTVVTSLTEATVLKHVFPVMLLIRIFSFFITPTQFDTSDPPAASPCPRPAAS